MRLCTAKMSAHYSKEVLVEISLAILQRKCFPPSNVCSTLRKVAHWIQIKVSWVYGEITAHPTQDHRNALIAYVYRLTSSIEDAKDITQETILRYISIQEEVIENPKAWMFKVATNLSLDFFKSVKLKRQHYIGPWLPEPYIDETATAEENIELDESISVFLWYLWKSSRYERESLISCMICLSLNIKRLRRF